MNNYTFHCVKCVCIRSYSGSHFPAFWLNTKKYRVSLLIQSECSKMLTRITPNTDSFHAVFVNGFEIFKFKAKDSEINVAPLCLSNLSRKTGLYRYVYSFLVDHDIDDFFNIHRYLMRKHGIKWCLDYWKSIYCHCLKYRNFI